jgi:hypothetical protein
MASTDRRAAREPSTPALPMTSRAQKVPGTVDSFCSGYRHSSAPEVGVPQPSPTKLAQQPTSLGTLPRDGVAWYARYVRDSAWSRCQGLGVRHQGDSSFVQTWSQVAVSARSRYRSVQHVSSSIHRPRDRCVFRRRRSLTDCGTRRRDQEENQVGGAEHTSKNIPPPR